MESGISGGQKQRIAIEHALVKQPAILILDEPTSALDAESKNMIQQTLNHLQADKTILHIAHQLSAIQDYDQILVMAHGCIVEQGTHDTLITNHGIYYRMYQQQNRQRTPTALPELESVNGILSKGV